MARNKQKQPNKGFKRSQKEWEESIAGHIGKAIDNGHALDYLLNAGLAIWGYNRFGPQGILMGPLALKLAQAPNIPASTAGVAILGYMGLTELGILSHMFEGAFGETPPIIGGKGGTPAFLLQKPIIPIIGDKS